MSSLILPDVTIPSSQRSFQLPEADQGGIIIFGKTLTEKSSTVMKIARYTVLLASHILPLTTNAEKIDITAIQKSLNGASAYEVVASEDSKVDQFLNGVSTAQKNISRWQQEAISTQKLTRSLAAQGMALVGKVDDILWAGENFGLGENSLSIGLHAVAYGGTVYTLIKKYIELAHTLTLAKEDPQQKALLNIKYAKFLFATGAALFGFLTLFIKTSTASVIWLLFAGGTAALSLGEYAYESSLNPQKREDPGIKKANAPITIDMTV